MKKSVIIVLLVLIINSAFAQKKDYIVTIHTTYGDMIAILYDETPRHKANFIKLAKEHFYDSLLLHRVIPGFMIQGGDPDSKHAKAGQALGMGGPDYTIEAEINPKFFHEKGALCAARLGDAQNPTKASSGSQFYIVQGKKIPEAEIKVDAEKFSSAMRTYLQNPSNKATQDSLTQVYYSNDRDAYQKKLMSLIPRVEKETGIKVTKDVSEEKLKAYTTIGGAPHLDGNYTVFGKVIKGLEVIDTIASQPKSQADRPQTDIRMTVTIEELSKKKIEKLYGYRYPEKK
jgi:peptidyl-prolyl cis-trans isomerase B (cyclophilin B)